MHGAHQEKKKCTSLAWFKCTCTCTTRWTYLGLDIRTPVGLLLTKGLSILDTQCALNRIESGLSVSTLMRIHPIPIRSGLIPIHLLRWFWSRLMWIAQLCVMHMDQKGCGMHARVNYRQWAHFSGLHTVFHVSAQLEKQYDGWLK